MLNKSASFYRWIFLNCLPTLLGCDNVLQVTLNITDGDSQEYGSLDLLLYIVQTNKDIENSLGRRGIEQVLYWLNVHVLVNKPTITLWSVDQITTCPRKSKFLVSHSLP